jgi:hypothetical protein
MQIHHLFEVKKQALSGKGLARCLGCNAWPVSSPSP